jgi:hypothetical protein
MLCAEVTKALRARKHEKMQRCEAIRQQHELLRRGDLAGEGAEQSGHDQVIYNQRCLFRSLTKKKSACLQQPAADMLPLLSFQEGKREDRHRGAGAAAGRGRHWVPALQSISEATSQSSVSESSTS